MRKMFMRELAGMGLPASPGPAVNSAAVTDTDWSTQGRRQAA
jgi:hypothetical protein